MITYKIDPRSDDSTPTNEITQAIRRYFSHQQKLVNNYKHGMLQTQGWLYNTIAKAPASEPPETSLENETLGCIDAALSQIFAGHPNPTQQCTHSWATAARYLAPRYSLDREALQENIYRTLAQADWSSTSTHHVIKRLIDRVITEGRRHWPQLPPQLTVLGQVVEEGSSALLCKLEPSGKSVLWVHGVRFKSLYWLFGCRMLLPDTEQLGMSVDEYGWSTTASASRVDAKGNYVVILNEREIVIPPMGAMYAQLTERAHSA